NAARHARQRVTVTLRAAGPESGPGPSPGPGGDLELVVADDGPGIDPADRHRVFDRFTRLDDARSRDEGGSGLGLPIAREIVEAHGGRISVGDGPGGRLVVRLPRAAGPGSGPGRSDAPIGGQVEEEPGAGGGGPDGGAA